MYPPHNQRHGLPAHGNVTDNIIFASSWMKLLVRHHMILCTSPSSNANVIIHVNKGINSYLRVFNVFISLSPPFFGGGRILGWVAIPFSKRSSQTRDWTQVSRIVGRRFTVWATGDFSRACHPHARDLIDREPDELWMEVRDIVQEIGIKTIPTEKKCKKSKMAVWGGLTNTCEKKRSEKQRRKWKIFPFECRLPNNS